MANPAATQTAAVTFTPNAQSWEDYSAQRPYALNPRNLHHALKLRTATRNSASPREALTKTSHPTILRSESLIAQTNSCSFSRTVRTGHGA